MTMGMLKITRGGIRKRTTGTRRRLNSSFRFKMLQQKRTKQVNSAKQINGEAQMSLCSSKLKSK